MTEVGSTPTTLNNRIALYTGNTYFLWPQLKFGGIMRPFEQYEELISVVVIYTFEPELPQRIAEVQVVAHETWRIASRDSASATREYIGSVQNIEQLDDGAGEFGPPKSSTHTGATRPGTGRSHRRRRSC